MPHPTLALLLLVSPSDDAWTALQRGIESRPADAQRKLVAAARAAADAVDDPFVRSVRAWAARAKSPAPRGPELTVKRKAAADGSQPLAAELPFPLHAEYVFGTGRIETAEALGRKPVAPVDEIRAMLLGSPPDLDLAFAAVERELDRDGGADEFARFLESWRNGDESFYRALDRTAGTPGEVFYFDAMLADFRQQFAKGRKDLGDSKTGGKSWLQATHDALHGAFLSYRQYRAMREALALSALLPPDARLPRNLARYEQAPAGSYSLRDEAGVLLAAAGEDLSRVLELAMRTAPPLPSPLWSAGYEPLAPFHAAFQKEIPELLRKGADTDALLRRHHAARAESARAVAQAVRKALEAAGLPRD